MRKSPAFTLPLLLVIAILFAQPALAVSITYVTPADSKVADGPVNARATFTTGQNLLTIVLENLQTNTKSVGQNLSDLTFTLSNPAFVTATFASDGNSALERSVGGDKTFRDGSTLTTAGAIGWVLTSQGSGVFHLDDLVGAGHAGPEHTILGPPSTPTTYSSSNASIAGNGPHNPFLGESVTWALNIVGLTADTTITAAAFSFGTDPDSPEIIGVRSPTVPEPSTVLLLALGLGGLAAWRWRCIARRFVSAP